MKRFIQVALAAVMMVTMGLIARTHAAPQQVTIEIAAADTVVVGYPVQVGIEIENTGSQADGVFSLELPEGARVIDMNGLHWLYSKMRFSEAGRKLMIDIADLPTGTTSLTPSLMFSTMHSSGGPHIVTARVEMLDGQPASGQDSQTLMSGFSPPNGSEVDLKVEGTVNGTWFTAQEPIEFRVKVTNHGTATATNVYFVVTSSTNASVYPPDCHYNFPGEFICPMGNIAPGQSWERTFTSTYVPSQRGGWISGHTQYASTTEHADAVDNYVWIPHFEGSHMEVYLSLINQ